MRNCRAAVLAIVFVATASGCDVSDWKKACSENTPDGYEAYAKRHPGGKSVTESLRRADALREDREWKALPSEPSISELRQFLEHHGGGTHAKEAQSKLNRLLTRTFTPPALVGKDGHVRSALREAGDEYKDYQVGAAGAPIVMSLISVAVVNNVTEIWTSHSGFTGWMATVPLDKGERSAMTGQMLRRCREYLQNKVQIADAAPYRLLVVVRGSDSTAYDSYNTPHRVMLGHAMLLDTAAKSVIWYAKVGRMAGWAGRDWIESIPDGIAEDLDALLGARERTHRVPPRQSSEDGRRDQQ